MRTLAGFSARNAVALGFAAFVLSACASSDVAPIKSANQSQINDIKVTDVAVSIETPRPQPTLKVALAEELNRTVPSCSKGETSHKLHVAVVDFEDQDVAKTVFLTDEIELSGRVELIDTATGEKTAEYYVDRKFAWGGLVGAALLSEAEKSLSEDFARIVCNDIFGADIE